MSDPTDRQHLSTWDVADGTCDRCQTCGAVLHIGTKDLREIRLCIGCLDDALRAVVDD